VNQLKHHLLIILLLTTPLAYSESVSIQKSHHGADEIISLKLKGLLPHMEYWAGIYKSYDSHDWRNVVSWPLEEITNGTIDFENISTIGKYEARLFYKNSYKLVDRREFTISEQQDNAESLQVDKASFAPDERVTVITKYLKSNSNYWLGIFEKSNPNSWENVVGWPLQNISNGAIEFESINETGEYEARLFYYGTTQLVDSVAFRVESDDCGTPWYSASLTYYTSYPEPDSEECQSYNGCKWAGQFYGLDEVQSKEWVAKTNIVAVHLKDWDWLGSKQIRIRQNGKEIIATAFDACADADCNGCCTENLGTNNFLLDLEENTKQRFGSESGTVQFQVCH
jgi:hypothetical protein